MQHGVRFMRSGNFVSRLLSEDKILVPINQTGVEVQKIYALNTTASVLWDLLEVPHTFEEIVSVFENEYSAPAGVIRDETKKVLEELTEDKIVTIIER